MRHDKKPYQARPLLKSIRYWQSIVEGIEQPKRPLAYYKNKLAFYTQDDINYLIKIAEDRVIQITPKALWYILDSLYEEAKREQNWVNIQDTLTEMGYSGFHTQRIMKAYCNNVESGVKYAFGFKSEIKRLQEQNLL